MTKLRVAAVAFLFVGTIALAACGGASDSGLFGGDSTFPGSTADGGATAVPPNAGAEAGSDRGGTADSPRADGSVGPGEGGLVDASPAPIDAAIDQGPLLDPGVKCGTETCAVPSDVCCRSGTAGLETFACAASGGSDCTLPGDLPVPCDDARDCAALGRPGSVCCAQETVDPVSQTASVTTVTCRSPGSCSGNGRRVVCDTTPGGCPAGMACTTTLAFPGFNLCQ